MPSELWRHSVLANRLLHMHIQECHGVMVFCRVDFHTQEYDPSAKDSHEDSRQLQEAVAQIFNVNGTYNSP